MLELTEAATQSDCFCEEDCASKPTIGIEESTIDVCWEFLEFEEKKCVQSSVRTALLSLLSTNAGHCNHVWNSELNKTTDNKGNTSVFTISAA